MKKKNIALEEMKKKRRIRGKRRRGEEEEEEEEEGGEDEEERNYNNNKNEIHESVINFTTKVEPIKIIIISYHSSHCHHRSHDCRYRHRMSLAVRHQMREYTNHK
jgi:hypothetical protein